LRIEAGFLFKVSAIPEGMAENPELEGVVREAMATYLKTVVKEFDPDLFEQAVRVIVDEPGRVELHYVMTKAYGYDFSKKDGEKDYETALENTLFPLEPDRNDQFGWFITAGI